ncbi:MAG: DUF559 domain-containing protein [Armatimonadetes bacterium]|nr:DUF559 domain-containing protein [Armatimonadota bacterium]
MQIGHLHRIHPETLRRAREMRHTQTAAEEMLWTCLRGRRLGRFKFRRQHPIGKYIADFCCPLCHLVVEVDGPLHEGREGYDANRQSWLEDQGYHVLRFSTGYVYDHFEKALEEILGKCDELEALSRPSP